jgi:hypothetical protein
MTKRKKSKRKRSREQTDDVFGLGMDTTRGLIKVGVGMGVARMAIGMLKK